MLESTATAPAAAPQPSAADAEAFRRDGYFVARALFSAAETLAIARWVEELRGRPETPGRQWMYFDATPGGRLLNRIENFAPFHAELDALLHGPRLLGLAGALFGEPALLFKDKINFKLPGGSGFDPHQDAQAGWNEYADPFITAAVAVDSATPANGCLELAHWAHRRELIGPLWQPLAPEQLRGIEFRPLPMEPGGAGRSARALLRR